ncbi:MAG TPA: BON domain-containing protein [Waddliaceae bacterium]
MFKRNAKIIGCIGLAYGLTLLTLVNADYFHKNSQSNNDESYGNKSEKIESGTSSDQDLAKKIRDKIGSGWFRKGYDEVQVQVRKGNVMLQGSVKTREDKEKVEKEVRNINGVRNVNSQISVQNPNSKSL